MILAQPEASAERGGHRIGWIWALQEAGSMGLRGTQASPARSQEGGKSYQGEDESGRAMQASEPTNSRA